ncbi:MAG: hypothetical protein K9M10_00615 [Candidatus Pacebacteria bacterium]|nr:hypothetical protein [Candidatus Paceibacterota bacterium]MCF7856965.1 hypothetical protein [Candidatus Paceibacterota bacterium]
MPQFDHVETLRLRLLAQRRLNGWRGKASSLVSQAVLAVMRGVLDRKGVTPSEGAITIKERRGKIRPEFMATYFSGGATVTFLVIPDTERACASVQVHSYETHVLAFWLALEVGQGWTVENLYHSSNE